jgi:hypothetical protein
MYRSKFSWPRHKLEVSGQLHASAALLPGMSSRYPFYRSLGGPQSRSGRYGEVNIFYPTGTRTPPPPGRPARSQSLYRLSYPGWTVTFSSHFWFQIFGCWQIFYIGFTSIFSGLDKFLIKNGFLSISVSFWTEFTACFLMTEPLRKKKKNSYLCLIKHHTMMMHGWVEA